jgi:hypothetical protein
MCDTGGDTNFIELEDPPTSIEDLPLPDTKRWVIRRKASVVYAVQAKIISLDEACERYGISLEEFESWQRLIQRHGIGGLRVTRLGEYRTKAEDEDS